MRIVASEIKMTRNAGIFFSLLLLIIGGITHAQPRLSLSRPDGLKVIVVNQKYPLIKVLLPNQPVTDRGIEIEFPEHVTGVNQKTGQSEHLYLVSMGNANKRGMPVWRKAGDTLIYESRLDGAVNLVASVVIEQDGLRYTYKLTNRSNRAYQNLQAVTCVKLYSLFADILLERTFVHQQGGFDLLASETPERLTMGMDKWLPCRYLVSYSWPINPSYVQTGDDQITRYNKSKKADKPFIATLSHDKQWVAATYTKETGNLWTNPERSCQHADPAVNLDAGETKTLELKTFIIKGNLDQLLQLVDREMKR
jgi:hypothetical protein